MFDAYSHAIASLGAFGLLVLFLGGFATVGRTSEMRCACGTVKRDYSNVVYRRGRAHANALEIVGPFIAAVVGAIMVGATPLWVNAFASVFLVSRIAMVVVHVGTENQPLRSLFWFIASLCVVALAILTIKGAF